MSNLFLRTFKHMTQNHHIQDDCLIAMPQDNKGSREIKYAAEIL